MGNNTSNATKMAWTMKEQEIISMCEEESWEFPDDRRCVYDLRNFAKYLDYVYTVAFTIGLFFFQLYDFQIPKLQEVCQ